MSLVNFVFGLFLGERVAGCKQPINKRPGIAYTIK